MPFLLSIQGIFVTSGVKVKEIVLVFSGDKIISGMLMAAAQIDLLEKLLPGISKWRNFLVLIVEVLIT